MSENVRSTSCRPWITLTMIVAMLGFAGLAFATPPVINHEPTRVGAHKLSPSEPVPGDSTPPTAPSAVPANDTCAGAIEIFLNTSQKVDSVGATDNYHTPATAACYQGLAGAQVPTDAPGRDVVFKFRAPGTDLYSVRTTVDAVTNDFRNQNGVVYLVDGGLGGALGCSGFATDPVACLIGANRSQSRPFLSAVGSSDNHGDEAACVPLAAGQVVYVVFDDFKANNNGSNPKIEVFKCNAESEPNDSPAAANPYVCDIQGAGRPGTDADCSQ